MIADRLEELVLSLGGIEASLRRLERMLERRP